MSLYMEIFSEKGNYLRIIESYKYRFHKRLRDGVQRWTCVKNSCKCYVKFRPDNSVLEAHTTGHNHVPDSESDLLRQKLSNAVKRKAVENMSEKPSKLVRREMVAEKYTGMSAGDLAKIRKNIYEARASVRPPLPKTLDELHGALHDYDHMITNESENFLLVNDPTTNIVIFSTKRNLEFLSSCSTIFLDGTFQSVPKLFEQLFTIHGFKYSTYVPLVFCLLPSKTIDTYEVAFRHIVNETIDLGLHFEPMELFADYEEAIHKAARRVWPAVSVQGCRFHLGQCWWRRIQKLGLTSEYKDSDSEIGNFLKLFFGLPCLHPADVEECFAEDLLAVAPDDERVVQFMDYVLDNYIDMECKFPPDMWAAYSSASSRTTNVCESFHAHLNGSFYAAHPHIYALIDTLLEFQCDVYGKIQDVRAWKKRRTTVKKETTVATLMTRRDLGEFTRIEFVKRVSFKFLPPPLKK